MDWFYTDGLYSCLAPFPQQILVWKTHGSHTESLPFKVIGIRIVDNADFSDVNFVIAWCGKIRTNSMRNRWHVTYSAWCPHGIHVGKQYTDWPHLMGLVQVWICSKIRYKPDEFLVDFCCRYAANLSVWRNLPCDQPRTLPGTHKFDTIEVSKGVGINVEGEHTQGLHDITCRYQNLAVVQPQAPCLYH